MGECGSVVKEGGSCLDGTGLDGSNGAMGSGTVLLGEGEGEGGGEVEVWLIGGIGCVGSSVSTTTLFFFFCSGEAASLSVVSLVFFGAAAAAAVGDT